MDQTLVRPSCVAHRKDSNHINRYVRLMSSICKAESGRATVMARLSSWLHPYIISWSDDIKLTLTLLGTISNAKTRTSHVLFEYPQCRTRVRRSDQLIRRQDVRRYKRNVNRKHIYLCVTVEFHLSRVKQMNRIDPTAYSPTPSPLHHIEP